MVTVHLHTTIEYLKRACFLVSCNRTFFGDTYHLLISVPVHLHTTIVSVHLLTIGVHLSANNNSICLSSYNKSVRLSAYDNSVHPSSACDKNIHSSEFDMTHMAIHLSAYNKSVSSSAYDMGIWLFKMYIYIYIKLSLLV